MILPPNDILNYWSAARLLSRGLSPYVFTNFYSEMQIASVNLLVYPFNYPPPALFWLLPLAFMDIEVASVVWRLVSIIFYVLAVVVIFKILDDQFKLDRKAIWVLIPTAICFPFYDWFWGNSNSIVFFLYALILRGLYYGISPFWIGLLFAGLGLKPHFFIPLGVCLSIDSIRRKNIKFFIGMFVGVAIQLAPIIYLTPNIIDSFLSALSQITAASHHFAGISIFSALHHSFGLTNPVVTLLIALIFVGFTLAFNKSHPCHKAIFIMPLAIAIAPHANLHAILFIAPAYWYMVCAAKSETYRTIQLLSYLMALLLVSFPYANWDKLFDIPISLLALMLTVVIFGVFGIYTLTKNRERDPEYF